jgi:hypothetical protein
MKKNHPWYSIVMNGADLLAVIPEGKNVEAAIFEAARKTGLENLNNVQVFHKCELAYEAFEGDVIVYRSKKDGDLVDVEGIPCLYALYR